MGDMNLQGDLILTVILGAMMVLDSSPDVNYMPVVRQVVGAICARRYCRKVWCEDFVICMPDTTLSDGYVLIDRLRNKWSERVILSNEETTKILCGKTRGSPSVKVWLEPKKLNVIIKVTYGTKSLKLYSRTPGGE